MSDAFLLAYFLDERDPDGEAIRFAVSRDDTPLDWILLAGGRPLLRSTVGEGGIRDPFLLRLPSGEVVLLATDLRVWPNHDWARTVRRGSRGVLVARTDDLVQWSDLDLVEVAPAAAGNAWAPKAFPDETGDGWLVFWASALYDAVDDRSAAEHQRILVSRTYDFRHFEPPSVYLDRGRDVIDATFLRHAGRCYRFVVDQRVPGGSPVLGRHPFEEVGSTLLADDYRPLTEDVGRGVIERGEGPAIASGSGGDHWYLLVDEFGLRGYQLFETDDLAGGSWTHRPDARLPAGARHGSMLPISALERQRLLDAHP